MCTADNCGALRPFSTPTCRKCNRCVPARPLAEGDVVPCAAGQPSADNAPVPDVNVFPPLESRFASVELPEDFLHRIQQLPVQGRGDVPHQFRPRMLAITADLVEGSNQGDFVAATLEQARTKLLLARIPKGFSLPAELRVRFGLWEAMRGNPLC